jgi:uncharacterized membrane protein
MSADEGASWAAAAAPTVGEVLRLQARLNAGKLALYDLALHAWIDLFGDGLVSMRAMSAALGTFAIVLVFFVARELFLPYDSSGEEDRQDGEAGSVAALSAIIFAISTVPIGYSREVRMYPVLLVATLAQVGFFLRSVRRGGIGNYAGVTIFTALSLAAHFTAVFMPASEGLWLLYLLASSRSADDAAGFAQKRESAQQDRIARRNAVWKLGASIALGVAIIAPLTPGALHSSAEAVRGGALEWIKPPRLWDALTLLKSGTGNFVLPVIAAIGAVVGWRRARGAVLFALLWMWVPVLMLLLVSYLLTPLMVERYALSSFVPLFILVALAVLSLNIRGARIGTLVLVILLAIGQDVRFYKHRHNDAQWREAAMIAASSVSSGQLIGVVPAYAVNVVRYYVAPEKRPDVVAMPDRPSGTAPAVAIIFDQGLSSAEAAALRAAYPEVVARLRRVNVARR